MTIYSHSRLNNFKECPLKFKFRYIDKLEEGDGIEAFMGSKVHSALHYLYSQVKEGNVPKLEEVLEYYRKLWNKEYHDGIRIVRKEFSARYYYDKGADLIKRYYENHFPFDENVIALEQKIMINLDGSDGKYVLQGFIDKLIYNEEDDCYEIHDYKTGKWLKSQEEADVDNQLALYSLGVREMFPDAKNIDLIWYFLVHEERVCSSRTDEELEELKSEVMALIDEIESSTEWPAKKSRLCDWCGYKGICDACLDDKGCFKKKRKGLFG